MVRSTPSEPWETNSEGVTCSGWRRCRRRFLPLVVSPADVGSKLCLGPSSTEIRREKCGHRQTTQPLKSTEIDSAHLSFLTMTLLHKHGPKSTTFNLSIQFTAVQVPPSALPLRHAPVTPSAQHLQRRQQLLRPLRLAEAAGGVEEFVGHHLPGLLQGQPVCGAGLAARR